MHEKLHHFLAWHPQNPNRNEPGRVQLSKAVSKCPKMHMHTCSRAVSHLYCLSSSSWLYCPALSFPTGASPFPVLFDPFLLPSFSCTVTRLAFSLSFRIASPIPSHPTPDSCPTAPFAEGAASCIAALLSLKQIQCILLLLEAALRGETFQDAQQSLWGI